MLGDDFHQILPVIPKASRAKNVIASVKAYLLWKHCEVIEPTKNMRLQLGPSSTDIDAMKSFAKWILDISEGKVGREIDD